MLRSYVNAYVNVLEGWFIYSMPVVGGQQLAAGSVVRIARLVGSDNGGNGGSNGNTNVIVILMVQLSSLKEFKTCEKQCPKKYGREVSLGVSLVWKVKCLTIIFHIISRRQTTIKVNPLKDIS